jgi:hypothetical protein
MKVRKVKQVLSVGWVAVEGGGLKERVKKSEMVSVFCIHV